MSEQQHDKDEASQPRPGDEIAPSRYRKLPVEIEAIRWCGTNLKAVIDFTGRHPSADEWTWAQFEEVVRTKGLKIFTLEGHHMASVGDYIIKGVHGEFYPCKPDIFWKTYERATAPLPETGTHTDHPLRHFDRTCPACTPADAKASLRRVVAFGGGDGYGQDKWNLRMAQCIEDLEVALASQIEITNTERAAKERLERELARAKERAADNAEAYENAEAKWYAAIQSASVPEIQPLTGDTPRTDAAAFPTAINSGRSYGECVAADFARQLEREVEKANARAQDAGKAFATEVEARIARSASGSNTPTAHAEEMAINEAGWELLRVCAATHANRCKEIAVSAIGAYKASLLRQGFVSTTQPSKED